jgi:hypothetical protein
LESVLRPAISVAAPPAQKSGGGFKRFLKFGCLGLLGLIVLVVVITLAAGGGGDDDDDVASNGGGASNATSQSGGSESDTHAALTEGTSAEVEAEDDRRHKITIVKITDDAQSDNQFLQPDAGNKYWAVEVLHEAVGDKAVRSGTWKLRTADGFEYDQEFVTDIGTSLDPIYELTPGGKKQGVIVFQIPEGAQIEWLRFDPNQFMRDDLYFDAQ